MMKIKEDFFTHKNEDVNKKNYSIEYFLDDNENVLWKGRPKKMAYVLGKTLVMMPFALLWGAIDFSVLFTIIFNIGKNSGMPITFLFFIIPFFAIHLFPFWVWLFGLIKAGKEQKYIEYVITNKRIIVFGGQERHIIDSALIVKICKAELKINFIDRILHVGDITVYTEDVGFIPNITGNSLIKITDISDCIFIHSKLSELCRNNVNSNFYENSIECEHCGTIYGADKSRCPSCGAPNKNKV